MSLRDSPHTLTLAPALLKALEKAPWPALSIELVAKEAGLAIPKIKRAFPDKTALLPLLTRWLDAQVKTGPLLPQGTIAADRLFEQIMARLDILAPYRPGLSALADEARRNPDLAFNLYRLTSPALRDLIRDSGLPSSTLQQTILTVVFYWVFIGFLSDPTPSLDRTMARLDRTLKSCIPLPKAPRNCSNKKT